jgi:creatinine amidohydrolase/Fe(II)-dependent formamide hydrolase-like protein
MAREADRRSGRNSMVLPTVPVGDATAASAEQGEQLFDTATDALCSFLSRVGTAE